VRDVFDKRKRIANVNMTLPAICGDTILSRQLFDHAYEPHLVWINQDGVVASITAGDAASSKNVKALLNKEPVVTWQKKDFDKVDFDQREPLFINGNGGPPEGLMWYSVVAGYTGNFDGGINLSADEKNGYSIAITNASIIGMCRFAFSNRVSGDNMDWLPLSFIELNLKDKTRFEEKSVEGEIMYRNHYTYQLIAPPIKKKQLLTYMQQDLQRYFNIDVKWEKRKKPCLVWTIKDTTRVHYDGSEIRGRMNDVLLTINGPWSVSETIRELETGTPYHYSPYPIIDETGFKGKLGGIEIETDINNHEALDKAFQKYGMRFKLEEREVDVLVITDK
jgi:hypothetical protein